jgi:predicted nucleic acid-binding Zn ribbon protein
MATYDFYCEVCSKIATIERSIKDKLDRVPYCVDCTKPMIRIYNPTPAIFKGKGWGGSK